MAQERNSVFYLTVLIFVTFIVGVVVHFSKVEKELNYTHKSIVILENARMLSSKIYFDMERKQFKEEKSINEISVTQFQLEKDIETIQKMPSQSVFGTLSTKSIFNDSVWKLDEIYEHILSLTEAYINKDGSIILLEEMKRSHQKVADVTTPVIKNLEKRKERILFWVKLGFSMVTLGFGGLLSFLYRYFYLPWREEFKELQDERVRLENLVDKAEEKGEAFYWEMNILTKEITRSKRLSGLLEIDKDSVGNEYLYDEISLFDESSREQFIKVLERTIDEQGSFDVEVKLVTQNGKFHWLDYYGEFISDVRGERVIATVYDISSEKLAENRFDSFFQSQHRPHLIVSESKIWDCNEAALKVLNIESKEQVLKLHPAVLFPMYQRDGKSSINRFKEILKEIKENNYFFKEWVFKRGDAVELLCDLEIIPLQYEEKELYLLALAENSNRKEFEKRLVNANRIALHARRDKIETLNELSIQIHQIADSIGKNDQTEASLEKSQHDLNLIWADISLRRSETELVELLFNLDTEMNEWIDYFNAECEDKKAIFIYEKDNHANKTYRADFSKIIFIVKSFIEMAINKTNNKKIELNLVSSAYGAAKRNYSFIIKDGSEKISENEIEFELNKKKSVLKQVLQMIEILQGSLKISFEKESGNIFTFTITLEEVVGEMNSKGYLYLVDSAGELIEGNDDDQNNPMSITNLWTHFGGDWGTIHTLLNDFISFYPGSLNRLKKVIREKDGLQLEQEATELYGILVYFPFHRALERVITLQKMGRYSNFDGASAQLMLLEGDLAAFGVSLEKFVLIDKNKVATYK